MHRLAPATPVPSSAQERVILREVTSAELLLWLVGQILNVGAVREMPLHLINKVWAR